jgi:hypothetical protein
VNNAFVEFINIVKSCDGVELDAERGAVVSGEKVTWQLTWMTTDDLELWPPGRTAGAFGQSCPVASVRRLQPSEQPQKVTMRDVRSPLDWI